MVEEERSMDLEKGATEPETKADLNQAPHKRPRLVDGAADGPVGSQEVEMAERDPGSAQGGGKGAAACLKAREKILAIERDYTRYYALNLGGEEGADQYVYKHFNSMLVVGIAPSHASISNGRQVEKVDFDVGRSGDKLANKPQGKKKAGAMFVKEDTRLCDIVCNDGTRFKVRPAVCGHLLEMNERLAENPGLLNSKAASEGWIAIIQPKRDAELPTSSVFRPHEEYLAAKAKKVE